MKSKFYHYLKNKIKNIQIKNYTNKNYTNKNYTNKNYTNKNYNNSYKLTQKNYLIYYHKYIS